MTARTVHALAAACLALASLAVASGCDAGRLRRMASHCVDNADCETGLCYQGRCSKACIDDTECGELLCLDNRCQAADTPCSDDSVCTVGDGWVAGKCSPGKAKACGAASFCHAWDCHPKLDCFKKATQPEAFCSADGVAPQGKDATLVCGDGASVEGGGAKTLGPVCRCALWQGRIHGPADVGATTGSDGKKVPASEGIDTLFGAAAAGKGVLAVGMSTAKAGATTAAGSRGWAIRVNGANQILWQGLYESKPPSTAHRFVRAAAAPDGSWMLAGMVGAAQTTRGWLVRLTAAGLETAQATPLPPGMTSAELSDIAAVSGGGWLAGGHGRNGTKVLSWLVRTTAMGEVTENLVLAAPAGATSATLSALAVAGDGWIAVGQSGSKGWLARLDPTGKPLWNQAILASGMTESGLRGVHPAEAGGGAAFGWARANSGDRVGWIVQFDAAGKVTWETTRDLKEFGAGEVEFVAGVLAADGQWLTAGSIVSGSKGWSGVVGKTAGAFSASPTAAGPLAAVIQVDAGFVLVGSHTSKTAAGVDIGDGWLLRMGTGFVTGNVDPATGACLDVKKP